MFNKQTSKKFFEKRKFNIIDAFIIILALICVLGIYFRSQITEWIGIDKQLSEYKIVFKVSEIKYTSGKYFISGGELFLDSPDIQLGTIDGNCTFVPSEVYLELGDGVFAQSTYPKDTYIDVFGAVKCTGAVREDGFYLEGSYSITPGMKLNVHTEMLDFTLTVTDIVEYGA